MSKHTEGPWFVTVAVPPLIYIEDQRRDGETICTVTDEGRPQDEANARLIAAAPDMLAMLKRVEWTWGECPCCRKTMEGNNFAYYAKQPNRGHRDDCELAALIAKAEGEA